MPRSIAASIETVDWSQYNDSVLIQVERAKGSKMGNTICSGVIIAPQVVLTTAHCAEEAISMTVVFDVEKGTKATKKEKVLSPQILIHPEYQPKKSLFHADLAILILKSPAANVGVDFNNLVLAWSTRPTYKIAPAAAFLPTGTNPLMVVVRKVAYPARQC